MAPSAPTPDGLLIVGRIGRPHGVRGEVYVDLLTDRTDRLDPGTQLWCRDHWLVVDRARPAGTRFLVWFEGISDRDTAARYTAATLSAAPLADDPEALWVHELIGAAVVEVSGRERGRCVSVVENPAADLLELDDGTLVPVTFVESFSDGVVTVDPPDGLFDDDGAPSGPSGASAEG